MDYDRIADILDACGLVGLIGFALAAAGFLGGAW